MDPIEFSQLRAIVEVLAPHNVLEWGAGGSTRALLEICPFIERYVSLEHDHAWFEKVGRLVDDPRLQLHHVAPLVPEPELPGRVSNRRSYAQRELVVAWRQHCEQDREIMRDYIEWPRSLDMLFDFVLIDGRARNFCIREGFDVAPARRCAGSPRCPAHGIPSSSL